MHFFAFLALAGLILALIFKTSALLLLAAVSVILTIYFGYQFVKWNFGMEPTNKFWVWFKMKYLTNLSFIQGGLKEFKKYKILCIEPSF
jgi:4-hydroxybenzoate polyprenyltransferase